jgi:hypothetical protein
MARSKDFSPSCSLIEDFSPHYKQMDFSLTKDNAVLMPWVGVSVAPTNAQPPSPLVRAL